MKSPNRKLIRWKNWDYRSRGAYFITICTKDKQPYFGEIKTEVLYHPPPKGYEPSLPYPHVESYLNSSPIGQIAWEYWREIPQHYPQVILDAFVIMPNHIHGILVVDKAPLKEWKPYSFGPQKETLSNIIGSYKAAVSRWANMNQIPFVWQRSYHDRVIRNAEEFERIHYYIWNNPLA